MIKRCFCSRHRQSGKLIKHKYFSINLLRYLFSLSSATHGPASIFAKIGLPSYIFLLELCFQKIFFLLDFSCSARSRLRSRLLILSRALWRVWDEKFRDLLLRNVNWISYGVVAFILRPQRKKPREAESKSSSSVIKCEIFFSVLGSKKTKLCSTSSWNGDWGRRDDMLWRGEDNEFSFRSIFKAFVNLGNPRSFACIIGRGPEVSLKFFRRIKLTAARALPPAG